MEGMKRRMDVLSVQDLSKSFGPNRVLTSVSLSVAQGEIVALLGENGAGKSTFAKILAGALRPDQGVIEISGKPVSLSAPRDALRNGVTFIPQELIYVPRLTVAENICLGRLPARLGWTSQRRLLRSAKQECDRLGLDLPLNREMTDVSLATQQLVEIVRALARRSSVLLLDEPTAALNSEETDFLLSLLQDLAKSGVAIIYVSHRLDEVYRLCSKAHVLRNGRLVASPALNDTRPDTLVGFMLGHDLAEHHNRTRDLNDSRNGPPRLSLLDWRSSGIPPLRGVSLHVAAGEIVSLYGVRGSGAEMIAEGLGEGSRHISGRLVIDGRNLPVFRSPRAAWRAGISYVPPDRKSQGLVPVYSVQESLSHAIIRRMSRVGFIRRTAERQHARRLIADYDVRCQSPAQPVADLSGGNQQKVLIASRLASQPRVLVLQEPTRGVDVGARLEIHRTLRTLAAEGIAIVMVTSDIEEAVTVSDRLIIMREGAFVSEIVGPTAASQSEALRAAGGVEKAA